MICWTAVVVTPNMVRPSPGRSSSAWGARRGVGSADRTMPASAFAPFASTRREIRLRPCTSVTEYIIMMSEAPT